MRTARSLPYGGGGGLCLGGSLCPGAVSVQGASVQGGSLSGGSMSRGPLTGGGLPDRDTLPVNRITDRCKNITFPQLR